MNKQNPIVPFAETAVVEPAEDNLTSEILPVGLGLIAELESSAEARPVAVRVAASGKKCKCGTDLDLNMTLVKRQDHLRQEVYFLCRYCQIYYCPENGGRFRMTF